MMMMSYICYNSWFTENQCSRRQKSYKSRSFSTFSELFLKFKTT